MSDYDNCNDIKLTLDAMGHLKIQFLLDSWVNCAKMAECNEQVFFLTWAAFPMSG